ncbi:hypothetical protein ElyMa_001634800 [Elysia marginata]|uniref:BED-type domain-containing protein n=1 Tax=Elysia marginata TaxID=1093978 RepID=A0AAV4JLI1_9GAST|nr:hypothetical protein ElyMa_001634800 [Elysia marginata]
MALSDTVTLLDCSAGHRAVSLSTFKREWKKYCPEIMVSKPSTELCWLCEDSNTKIQRSTNMATKVKQHLIENQSNHLTAVTTERSLYNECVRQAKETINVE